MARKRIVFIEDDQNDQILTTRAIKDMEPAPNVTVLSSGEEAIDFLNNCALPPDLIFVDYNLPRMTGIEVIKEMKKEGRYKSVPFVMLSDNDSIEVMDEALDSGAWSYINKLSASDPLNWGYKLKGAIYYWLDIHKARHSLILR